MVERRISKEGQVRCLEPHRMTLVQNPHGIHVCQQIITDEFSGREIYMPHSGHSWEVIIRLE